VSQDPFDTAGIRRRVLRGWVDEPARLREDANAEEDYARGGYRDRVVIELAQNAADAAARAGIDGRCWLRLDPTRLTVANTGAPLDAAAVLGLATLRASAKREDDENADTVGRFGVGFSAVLAITDRPAVVGHRLGVRFDARLAAEAVSAAGDPALLAEVARRDGQVPVLRLPFAVDLAESTGERLGPPDGYDTQVTLPLRDAAAYDLTQRLLGELDEALLLALPGLHEIRIDVAGTTRLLTRRPQQWHLVRREGRFSSAQLADRPTEERHRPGWHLTWALPTEATAAGVAVVHAPTPTDESLDWPALLIATFPLEPSRRHIAPGLATDALVAAAAAAYADLVTQRAAAGEQVWRLLPVGLPAPGVDAALRVAVLDELRRHPILPGADGTVVRPLDATVIDGPAGAQPQVTAVLAAAVPGLVTAPRPAAAGLRWLAVGTTSLADAVEQLPLPSGQAGWAERYQALAAVADDATSREALAVMAVPLHDGRVVRGARGLVIAQDVPAEALSTLGVRVVAAAATHPLLQRLGAEVVAADQVLDLPEVRAAVTRSRQRWDQDLDDSFGWRDEPGQDDVMSAVLSLVERSMGDRSTGDQSSVSHVPSGAVRSWLPDLVLRDEDDEPAPAGELVLPGSPAERWLDPEAFGVVSAGLLERWGPSVLAAAGVVSALTVTTAHEVPLTQDGALLASWSDWVGESRARLADAYGLSLDDPDVREAVAAEVKALPDLDAVVDEAWPQVWRLLIEDPEVRAAVVPPTRLVLGGADGTRIHDVPSWSAWWLRRRLFSGRAWADPTADVWLQTLLGAPASSAVRVAELDPQLRRALGSVSSAAELAEAGTDTLTQVGERLADPDVEVAPQQLIALWAVLAQAGEALAGRLRPPRTVRALRDGTVVLVPGEQAVVVDGPLWLQRHDLGAMVVAPQGRAEALAEVLDLAVADELAPGRVGGDHGVPTPVIPMVAALLERRIDTWYEHEDLMVDGHPVDWWVEPDGVVHACTLDGLARALAWAGGCWGRRHVVVQLLTAPTPLGELVDVAFE
jgi:hypothetical protein